MSSHWDGPMDFWKKDIEVDVPRVAGIPVRYVPGLPRDEAYLISPRSFVKLKFGDETLPREEDPLQNDDVNHPVHYTNGKHETIEVIEDWDKPYHISTALKYLARFDLKGNPEKDLQKAMWYIKRYLQVYYGHE